MLYEEILRGCEKYHRSEDGKRFDKDYNDYMSIDRDESKWNQPNLLDLAEAGKLMGFLNLWKTPVQVRLVDLLPALQETARTLEFLKDITVLDANLNESSQQIMNAFDNVANCGTRYESTAASKILHTINPHFFVMWDNDIRNFYGELILNKKSGFRNGAAYILFLLKMQEFAKQAVDKVVKQENISREDAIKFLTPCSNTLAKVIDEFNFAVIKSLKD